MRKKKGEEKRRSAGNKKQGEGIFPTEMVSRGGIGEQFLLRKGESVGPSISLFHGPPTHTTSHSHTFSPKKISPFFFLSSCESPPSSSYWPHFPLRRTAYIRRCIFPLQEVLISSPSSAYATAEPERTFLYFRPCARPQKIFVAEKEKIPTRVNETFPIVMKIHEGLPSPRAQFSPRPPERHPSSTILLLRGGRKRPGR